MAERLLPAGLSAPRPPRPTFSPRSTGLPARLPTPPAVQRRLIGASSGRGRGSRRRPRAGLLARTSTQRPLPSDFHRVARLVSLYTLSYYHRVVCLR